MRFGAVVNCMNEHDLLPGCLALLDVEVKVVVISDRTYKGDYYQHDDSEAIALKHGAIVLRVDSDDQVHMRNLGLALLQGLGIDMAFIVDTDEYYPTKTLEAYKEFIGREESESYKARMLVSFRRPHWTVPCPRDSGSVIAIRTDKRMKKIRSYEGPCMMIPDELGVIHHISYARSPKKIQEKIVSFSHADEVIPGWYDEVFLPCSETSHNVHPTVPEAWPDIKVVELPEEVVSNLPKHLWTN